MPWIPNGELLWQRLEKGPARKVGWERKPKRARQDWTERTTRAALKAYKAFLRRGDEKSRKKWQKYRQLIGWKEGFYDFIKKRG
jgi:hypothetical protein